MISQILCNLAIEIEKDGKFSFPSILVQREDGFVTSVYWKQRLNVLFISFQSFAYVSYKHSLIHTLLFYRYSFCVLISKDWFSHFLKRSNKRSFENL